MSKTNNQNTPRVTLSMTVDPNIVGAIMAALATAGLSNVAINMGASNMERIAFDAADDTTPAPAPDVTPDTPAKRKRQQNAAPGVYSKIGKWPKTLDDIAHSHQRAIAAYVLQRPGTVSDFMKIKIKGEPNMTRKNVENAVYQLQKRGMLSAAK